MMTARIRTICLMSLAALVTLAACHDDDHSPHEHEADITFTVPASGWVFLSLETDGEVATCALDDTLTLRAMHDRTDWDIALSSDGHIRTNGGASGVGQGGIATTPTPLDAADYVPAAGYTADDDTADIW